MEMVEIRLECHERLICGQVKMGLGLEDSEVRAVEMTAIDISGRNLKVKNRENFLHHRSSGGQSSRCNA
ncbi:hypothetical protein V6N13_092626 [Hibiscus sabdariffa]